MWLLLRVEAPGAGLVRALIARWLDSRRGGVSARQGLLLIPVTALALLLLGPRYWFGMPQFMVSLVVVFDAAIAAASLVLVFRSRVWAATVAVAGLLVLGAYGLLIACVLAVGARVRVRLRPACTDPRAAVVGGAVQGTALLALGLWLAPRVMREHEMLPADSELAARAQQLTQRVQTLTGTRTDAVDTAAAELRRIERDLHDGAQARLVALGMSLRRGRAAHRHQPRGRPRAGRRGQGEPRSRRWPSCATWSAASTRRCWPTAAWATRSGRWPWTRPLPIRRGHRPARPARPRRSSRPPTSRSAELLANAAKHAARQAGPGSTSGTPTGCSRIERHRRRPRRRRPAAGAPGWRHRAAAGYLRRHPGADSPPGGPTIVTMELPCALSSPKTSSCCGTAWSGCCRRTASRSSRPSTTAPALLRALRRPHRPDVAVVDVRLPPTFTDEGLQAALAARREVPGLPVLVLSQYVEQLYARELLADRPAGSATCSRTGSPTSTSSSTRSAGWPAGGTAMDPEVIAQAAGAPRPATEPLAR